MKKYDFFALHCAVDGKKHPPFLQDFCKNAQWRAKKLRERGSSTARPTEKGVGGLTIRSRFGRDLRTSSWRFVLIRSSRSCRVAIRRVGSVDSVARPVDFGASRRVGVLLVSRFGRFRRDLRTSSWRFGRFGRFRRVASSWSAACVAISARRVASKSRRKHKKSPIPQSGNRA